MVAVSAVGDRPHRERDAARERHRLEAWRVPPQAGRLQEVARLIKLLQIEMAGASVDGLLPAEEQVEVKRLHSSYTAVTQR